MWKRCSLVAKCDSHKKKARHSDTHCSLLKQLVINWSIASITTQAISNIPNIYVTLSKDTFSFIRFINILQATELNKGQIKYHRYFMRQRFRYKVSVSREYPLLSDLKQTNRISVTFSFHGKPGGWKTNTRLMREFLYLLIYTLSMPSSSGVEMPSSSNVGLSSWITYG